MAIIEEFVLKIKAKTDDLIRGGNEVERQKKKFTDDQKRRDKEEEKRRKKELDYNKQVKRDLLDRIKHTKDLALKITGLAGIFSAVGMAKLTDDTIKQANALQFLSKETGVAASRAKALQDANRLGGGTAEGMSEALRQAASDMALLRQGKSFSELQGGMLLAKFGGAAGIDWNDAMSGEADKFLLAKMRVIDWIQKQKKENLGGIDPRQMASQLAIEAGMGGVLNANQDFTQFQKDLAARSRVAGLASGQEDTARKAQRELTQIQLQFEDLTKTIVMQAVAPEITKIGKAIGSLSERDKQKAVETIQKIIQGIETLATDFYKLSQDKDTKEFFKEVGGAVSTATHAIDDTVKGTIGWKNAIEGLIGLRLLAFFAGLAGAIGLGAGVGVTGAILAAAGAVALLAGNFDKVKESSKKAIGFVAEKLGLDPEGAKYAYEETINKASNAMEWIAQKATDIKQSISTKENPNLIKKLHEAGKKYGFNADEILKTYQESGLDPNILLAQAYQESKFNPNVISPKGARGFAQFMPDTAKQYGMSVFDSMDAEKSAKAQVKYMQHLKKELGSYQSALAGYNWGEGKKGSEHRAKILSKQGLPKETSDYINIITQLAGAQDTTLTKTTIPQGLRIKSKEALAGGKTEQGTLDLAQAFQDAYPNQVKWFSAFNDKKHQGTGSGHEKGLKFDVTLTDGSGDKSTKMVENLKAIAAQAGVTIKVLDEYKHKSKGWTGPHLDVGFKNAEDAKKFADFYREKNKKQETTPRAPVIPVDYTGTNPINPLPTPLPAPLPPPGATTNNQSAVNNATINNTFNIKSTEPKAAANEIKSALDSYANFSNPVVNSFNTGFSE